MRARVLPLLLALVIATACSRDRPAGSGDFFGGRTITYVVASNAGGGYDTYARIVAKSLARHLPGSRVVVRNAPGAGGLIGANEIYRARPDGLTIGTFTFGFLYPQLVGDLDGQLDLEQMSWIGKAASEPRILALGRATGIATADDLLRSTTPIRLATTPPGTSAFYATQILAEAVGFKIDVVPGFDEDEGQLAMLRGDVHGLIASPSSLRPVIDQGLAHMVLRVGDSPDTASVAAAADFATTDRGRALVALLAAQSLIGRLTVGPPGIPQARLDVLRRAYSAALQDPELLADAARLRLPIDPLDGEAVAERVRHALDASAEAVAWLRALSPHRGLQVAAP